MLPLLFSSFIIWFYIQSFRPQKFFHYFIFNSVERYNGIIWKSILLALESQKMSTYQWEQVLPDALHAICTLLSTATNETPHERFFKFHRKASHGCAVPSWLTTPGKVYLELIKLKYISESLVRSSLRILILTYN